MEPRPAFRAVVLGADLAPPDLVADKLDLFLGPKLGAHNVGLILRDSHAAGDWSRQRAGVQVVFLGPYPQLWPRDLAEVRWAMEAAAMAEAAVLFGPDRKHWRILRYLKDAAVPVRRVRIPDGYAPPERPRPVPWRFDPGADPLAQPEPDDEPPGAVLDGAGPGGWPD